jgi:hypothetical protein
MSRFNYAHLRPAVRRRLNRPARHLCKGCGAQRALFRYRGEVRADRHHTLCFRCFRSERDRQRARRAA